MFSVQMQYHIGKRIVCYVKDNDCYYDCDILKIMSDSSDVLHAFFKEETLFFNSASVLHNFFMN